MSCKIKLSHLTSFSLWTKTIEGQTWKLRDWLKRCQLKSDTCLILAIKLDKDWVLATAIADFHTLKGIQGGDQEKGTLCSGKTARTGLQIDNFRGKFYESCFFHLPILRASLVAQMVKNLPAMWETCVQSLGQEDSLEKGMTTHFRILAWRILWTEEPGGLQSMGSHRVG